jgi:hypothetical protein
VFPDGGGWVELEGFIELNRILRKDMDFHSSSPEASSTSAAGTFMDVGVGDAMDGAVPGHDGEKIDGNGANGAGDDGGDGWGDARDSSIQWQVLEATETAKDTMWQQMTDPETGTVYFYSGTRGLLGGESAWAIPFQVGWTSHVQEDTGYVYFANDSNGDVSWSFPSPALQSAVEEEEEEEYEEEETWGDTTSIPLPESQITWKQVVDEATQTYFYLSSDEETQWDLPEQDGWTTLTDEDTGNLYFSNE